MRGGNSLQGMTTSSMFCHTAMVFALTIPTGLQAQGDRRNNEGQAQGDRRNNERQRQENNRRYHDARNKDDHEWNNNEDRAYRMWVQENHRKYNDFSTLPEREQQSYWGWRHNHSDAQLNIEIR
jgi:hypothetical protein